MQFQEQDPESLHEDIKLDQNHKQRSLLQETKLNEPILIQKHYLFMHTNLNIAIPINIFTYNCFICESLHHSILS